MMKFEQQKQSIPLSSVREHVISTVSLFVALFKVGAFSLHNNTPSINYTSLTKSLFSNYMERYRSELSLTESKSFAMFSQKIISETYSDLQQSTLSVSKPVTESLTKLQNLSVQNSLVQNMGRQPNFNGQLFNYSSQNPQNFQQNIEFCGSKISPTIQTSDGSAFVKLSFKVASTSIEAVDQSVISAAFTSSVIKFQKIPNLPGQKELIVSFLEDVSSQYQQTTKNQIKFSSCDPLDEDKSFLCIKVKFERSKLLLNFYYKNTALQNTCNNLQSGIAPVNQVTPVSSEQVQFNSTMNQQGSSSVLSRNLQSATQQPEKLSNKLQNVANTSLNLVNRLSLSDAIKQTERLSQQSVQVNGKTKDNFGSNNLIPISTKTNVPPSTNGVSGQITFDGGFTQPVNQYIVEVRNKIATFFPFRVLFSQFTTLNSTNQSDFDKVMISFNSVPVLIAESIINCLVKSKLTSQDLNTIQVVAKKTAKYIVDTLTLKQLKESMQKNSNFSISVRQLMLLPKDNIVYRTLTGGHNKTGKYNDQEIKILSYLWINIMPHLKIFVKSRYQMLQNSNISMVPPENCASLVREDEGTSSQTLLAAPALNNNSEILSNPPNSLTPKSVDFEEQEADNGINKNIRQGENIGVTKLTEEASIATPETSELEQQVLLEKSDKPVTHSSLASQGQDKAFLKVSAVSENSTNVTESIPLATVSNFSTSSDVPVADSLKTVGDNPISSIDPTSPKAVTTIDDPTVTAKHSSPKIAAVNNTIPLAKPSASKAADIVDDSSIPLTKLSPSKTDTINDTSVLSAKAPSPRANTSGGIPNLNSDSPSNVVAVIDSSTSFKSFTPQEVTVGDTPISVTQPSPQTTTNIKDGDANDNSNIDKSTTTLHASITETPKPTSKVKPHFIDTLISLDIPDLDKSQFENRISLFNSEGEDSDSEVEENSLVPKIKMFKKLAAKDIANPGEEENGLKC